MARQWRTKTFKSGNSIAVRLPKSAGMTEGDDVVLVPHDDGSFSFWREQDGARVLDGLFGAFSAGFMAEGRGDIEQADRDWDGQDRAA